MQRFNRYMVECELICSTDWLTVLIVLIDTWWNVNYDTAPCCISMCSVLIDTWWNVNDKKVLFVDIEHTVLIDTWWNVNEMK